MRTTLSIVAASLLLLLPAQAEEFSVGAWTGNSFYVEGTNEFSHCAIWAPYVTDDVLVFSITSAREIVLGLANLSWTLQAGESYPVNLRVDSHTIGQYQARADSTTNAYISLPYSEDTITALRKGRSLYVGTTSQTLTYLLTGTNAALPRLQDCVFREMFQTKTARNPFGADSASKNPFGSTSPSRDTGSQDDEDAVKEMLKFAGLSEFRFIRESEREGYFDGAVYVWGNGNVFGAVYGIDSEDIEAGMFASVYVGSFEDACDGEFTYGLQPDYFSDGTAVRRAFSKCKDSDLEIVTSFLFFEIEGAFVTVVHLGPGENAAAVQSADEAIFKVWDTIH